MAFRIQILKFSIISFFILCIPIFSYTQIESPGIPLYSSFKSAGSSDDIQIDISSFNRNDVTQLDNSYHKSLKIAEKINVDIECNLYGSWQKINDINVWHAKIIAPGAKSIGLLLGNYNLPEGVKLFVYNDTGIKGAFTRLNNKLSNTLMIAPLGGEKIHLELQVPGNVNYENELKIEAITYGIIESSLFSSISSQASQVCNVDINCYNYEPYQTLKNAVVRILGNGEDLCTGTLINNTSEDGKAYILTANHCVSTNAAANNTIFLFNYESPFCDGPNINLGNTISGSTLIATKYALDFSLLELSVPVPYHYYPYYAGWSLETSGITNTFTIHHPDGDVKKITIDNDSPVIGSYSNEYDNNAFHRILEWDVGTTEGGSSGGPLFDNYYRLIGTLTGGTATCANNINDYYARFDREWDDYLANNEQLKNWLDPNSSNVNYMDGMDPYHEIKLHSFLHRNISSSGDQIILEDEPVWGYITGHNSQVFKNYAEKFTVNDSASIVGVTLHVARAVQRSLVGRVRIKVKTGSLDEANKIFEDDYPIEYFVENEYNNIRLDDFYPVFGDVYVEYQLFYLVDQDTFALYHKQPSTVIEENTAYTYRFDLGWVPIYTINNEDMASSLDIGITLYDPDYTVSVKKMDEPESINLFPNPCSDILTLEYEMSGESILYIYDIQGRKVHNSVLSSEETTHVNVSGLPNGVYFIKLHNNNSIKIGKFIVIH